MHESKDWANRRKEDKYPITTTKIVNERTPLLVLLWLIMDATYVRLLYSISCTRWPTVFRLLGPTPSSLFRSFHQYYSILTSLSPKENAADRFSLISTFPKPHTSASFHVQIFPTVFPKNTTPLQMPTFLYILLSRTSLYIFASYRSFLRT